MDYDTSDSAMSITDSESDSDIENWPNGKIYFTPKFLKTLQERLVTLKINFRKFLEESDEEVGLDLEWMLVHVCEKSFVTIRFIAMFVPRRMELSAGATTKDVVSELQALTSNATPPAFVSQIDALPHPEWNDVFQGYCRVLEASVEAYVIGDSPVYKPKLHETSTPDVIFRVLRRMIVALERYPILKHYQERLMMKLGGSRSGVIWTEWCAKEAQVNPPPKRKLDALDLDDDAKKRIMKEMGKNRKLDRLMNSPPDR